MKILVLSDSHSGLSFMRYAIRTVKPDAVIHLGDYFDDGQTVADENPHLVFHQVAGNRFHRRRGETAHKFRSKLLCRGVR